MLQNAHPWEHSAIPLTCIKRPFSIKTFVLSIYKRPLKTGFAIVLSVLSGLAGKEGFGCFTLTLNVICYFYIMTSVSIL